MLSNVLQGTCDGQKLETQIISRVNTISPSVLSDRMVQERIIQYSSIKFNLSFRQLSTSRSILSLAHSLARVHTLSLPPPPSSLLSSHFYLEKLTSDMQEIIVLKIFFS